LPTEPAAIQEAMQGACDAEQLRTRHRSTKLQAWIWITVPCESATFVITQGDELAHMVANTDDFARTQQKLLDKTDILSESEWKITTQQASTRSYIIQHAGIKIQNKRMVASR
jgi:hypothetical protein